MVRRTLLRFRAKTTIIGRKIRDNFPLTSSKLLRQVFLREIKRCQMIIFCVNYPVILLSLSLSFHARPVIPLFLSCSTHVRTFLTLSLKAKGM
jgi:hypothetical protein